MSADASVARAVAIKVPIETQNEHRDIDRFALGRKRSHPISKLIYREVALEATRLFKATVNNR